MQTYEPSRTNYLSHYHQHVIKLMCANKICRSLVEENEIHYRTCGNCWHETILIKIKNEIKRNKGQELQEYYI